LLSLQLASLAVLVACAGGEVGPSYGSGGSSPPPDDDGPYGGGFPAATAAPGDDAGDATVTDPTAEAAAEDEGAAGGDALPAGLVFDAGPPLPDGACVASLGAGDLTIDELMIESVAGAGDDGEWLEVASTVDCVANLRGLHGECPRGSKVASFDVTIDLWLPPKGTFIIADSADPAINHSLPGALVTWLGHTGDILRNQGTTVTLSADGVVIDSLTYPSLALMVGVSYAFPGGCDPSLRGDFTRWETSNASWFPGFHGTPNAPNTDVAPCP
jgi:hypothetical protein